MKKKITKQSVSDQVYEVVKESIIDFKRKPGDKLNVDELCKEYGVSNTPIREAIKRLQQDGFVEQRVNAGFFVKSISHQESMEYSYFIRTMILGSIEELIYGNQLDAVADLLEKQLDVQRGALGKDAVKFLKEAIHFDEIFIKVLDNPVLTDCMERMNEMFGFSVYHFHKDQENRLTSLQDHENIIATIRAGEYDNLKQLIRQHYDFGTDKGHYTPPGK